MNRIEALEAAKQAINGSRDLDFGEPEDNFSLIAEFWTVYLGCEITALDVAMLMALLKVARIMNGGGSGDSFVDAIGYCACGAEIAGREEE